jgi:hypothetical protein
MNLIFLFWALSNCLTNEHANELFSGNCFNQNMININAQSDPDSLILKEVLNVNFRNYIGKTVDSFLLEKTICKFTDYTFIQRKPLVLYTLSLRFSENVFVETRVRDYKYEQPFRRDIAWKLELYRKEIISEINVIYRGKYVYKTK